MAERSVAFFGEPDYIDNRRTARLCVEEPLEIAYQDDIVVRFSNGLLISPRKWAALAKEEIE